MPTYTNTRAGFTQVGDVTFGPSEVKELYNYIDLKQTNGSYITLTSHAPYWNPVIDSESITGTGETKNYTCSINSSNIRVFYVSGNVTMFINSTSNIPGMILKESIILDNRGKVNTLHFVFSGAGEVLVQENA